MHIWTPYCGAAPVPGEWLFRWNLDPWLLLGLTGLWLLLWQVADRPQRRYFLGGALALAVLLFVSPLCALSSALFAVRVSHHVLLTAAIAPLLVLASPRDRFRLPGTLAFWTSAQAVIFWLWHAPPLYAAAMDSHAVYWLMQLTLLASAGGFWLSVRRASEPAAVAALLGSTVQMGLLGAIVTFAAVPLYAPHFASTAAWGLTPLEDQQLAGLIMWAPSAAIYLGAALFIANRWLGREGRTVSG